MVDQPSGRRSPLSYDVTLSTCFIAWPPLYPFQNGFITANNQEIGFHQNSSGRLAGAESRARLLSVGWLPYESRDDSMSPALNSPTSSPARDPHICNSITYSFV